MVRVVLKRMFFILSTMAWIDESPPQKKSPSGNCRQAAVREPTDFPNNSPPSLQLLYLRQGKVDRAQRALEEAKDLGPKNKRIPTLYRFREYTDRLEKILFSSWAVLEHGRVILLSVSPPWASFPWLKTGRKSA